MEQRGDDGGKFTKAKVVSSAASGYSAFHVFNPGQDGVRRPVKRRVQTRII